MKLFNTSSAFVLLIVLLNLCISEIGGRPQNDGFELPVELVGFPVIITAVRLSNFVKKLAYSLSPSTYVNRSKREAIAAAAVTTTAAKIEEDKLIDIEEAEKRLVEKFGEDVCITRRTCLYYAGKAAKGESNNLNWPDILDEYKSAPDRTKEYHLLSVFLGDIIGSKQFCNQLAKRRECKE